MPRMVGSCLRGSVHALAGCVTVCVEHTLCGRISLT